VEDIYNILQINMARRKVDPSATVPKAQLMATYYEKLTTLFWVSENHLFHGFAWYKYYTLCKEFNNNNNNRSEEEKRMQASAVLLAALCIPPTPSNSGKMMDTKGIRSTVEDDMVKQKMGKMATLLGFHTKNPTREALLGEIRSKRILDEVPQYMRDLYAILEENSDPLTMVDQAKPLLETLKKEVGASTSISTDHTVDVANDTSLGRYVAPLTHVLLLKLICNLSAAYHTVSIEHLKKLTAGLDIPFEQVEKTIVQFTQTKMVVLSIDHRSGCLRFGNAELESDTMRSQLTLLSKQLQSVVNVLKPPDTSKIEAERKAQYAAFRLALPTEHKTLVERRTFIEKKKEEAERLAQEKAKEELEKKALEDAARKAEEENRIRREQKQREQEKHRKIQEELETKEKMRILVTMGKNTDEITQEEMAKLDTEALQKEHEAKINKDKEEAERKTQEAAKKLDYLVRAIRIEELPLIKAQYEEKVKNDRERYEHDTVEKLKNAKQRWESDVTDKETLAKHNVFAYFGEFRDSVMAGRKKEHKVLCQAEDARAEKFAEEAKFERARKRRDDELKRIAAEEARKKEEEERAKAEEEARQKEAIRKEREAKEEEKRVAEQKRMDEERKKKEGATTGKYVPPSMRGRGAAAGSSGTGTAGNDRDRGGMDRTRGAYPGGGRYEGRTGGGGSGAPGGGGGGGFERRAGGFGDRQGDTGDIRFGGDRRGDGGSRFGGDRRDGDRPGDRGGGGGGGDRYGNRGGSDRPGDRGSDRPGDRDSGDRGGGSSGNSPWRRS
jgi:translation initiation factor 3 subunit A